MAKKKVLSSTEKAVCYIRVSTEEQATTGVSLDAQEKKVKAYCELNDLEIVEIIREEGVSAGKDLCTRPGGAKLLELIKKRQVNNVVTLKLDRLFRDAANALTETKAWNKEGVGLHLIDQGGQSINTSTSVGRQFLINLAGFAEFERTQISERTTQALQFKKANNKAYSPTPFGYTCQEKNLGSKIEKILIENKSEQKILKQIRQWRDQGWSLRKIADELNNRAIPTKHDTKWYASTVTYLLNNDLYESEKNK